MIRKMYDFFILQATKPTALFFLALTAFFGSIFSPFPCEMLFIPICLAAPQKAYRAALIATIWSLLGGIAGYAVGRWFFVSLGLPMLETFGLMNSFHHLSGFYKQWESLLILVSGISPFPYKIFAVLSGMVETSPILFLVASAVSRFMRFYLLAWALHRYGNRARLWIERNLEILFILTCLLIGLVIYLLM